MEKIKYTKQQIQLCLFKVALCFSVFAFTGYNVQAESAFQQSIQTELVESKVSNFDFNLNNFTKTYIKIPSTGFQFDIRPYNSYALLYTQKLILIKYKNAFKETLSYNVFSIKLLVKKSLSSSEDEFHFLSAT